MDSEFPPIWKVLADGGARVRCLGAFTVSGAWGSQKRELSCSRCFCPSLRLYSAGGFCLSDINLALVRVISKCEQSDSSTRGGKAGIHLGSWVQIDTVTDVLGQLLAERAEKWKTAPQDIPICHQF